MEGMGKGEVSGRKGGEGEGRGGKGVRSRVF